MMLLNGGVSIAPREARVITVMRQGTAKKIPVAIPVAGATRVATKKEISTAKLPINGKRKGNVIDVMQTLGAEGLAKVYVSGGAFGSKTAVKTTYEEFFKAKDYPLSDLEKIWGSEEWKAWQPKTTVPIIPSVQIPEIKMPDLGTFLGDLKTPLIIAAVAIGGLLLLPSLIGAFKK